MLSLRLNGTVTVDEGCSDTGSSGAFKSVKVEIIGYFRYSKPYFSNFEVINGYIGGGLVPISPHNIFCNQFRFNL